jgi:hypothetical protein
MEFDPLVFRSRSGRAGGRIREQIVQRQTELVASLRELDGLVERLVERRAELVEGLRICRDAMGGVGTVWMPRDPLPGEVDAVPTNTRPIGGAELRAALRQILACSERPLTVSELHRGLLARGLRPAGRASKCISDALRWELRRGSIEQVRRGEYVGVAPSAA